MYSCMEESSIVTPSLQNEETIRESITYGPTIAQYEDSSSIKTDSDIENYQSDDESGERNLKMNKNMLE